MVIGQESKHLIKDNFSELFKFFQNASITKLEGTDQNPFFKYGYKAFQLTIPVDMSAHQMTLKEGTAKVKETFCNY